MWIPKDAAEVEDAAGKGHLTETAIFEAKSQLPESGKNEDIAKDIATMTVNGGVILYGIKEDKDGRLTIPSPIVLKGVPERIQQTVTSSISEPPKIAIYPLPRKEDPTTGYLAVLIPQSHRAPHMLVTKKEQGFFHRVGATTAVMSEAEVAGLYARRQRWEVDREVLLDQAIEHNYANRQRDPNYGDLHVFIHPVVPDDTMLGRVGFGKPFSHWLWNLQSPLDAAYPRTYSPTLGLGNCLRLDEGWRCGSDPDDPKHKGIVDLTITDSGIGYLLCGRAAELWNTEGIDEPRKRLWCNLIHGLTTGALLVLGKVYAEALYAGAVDVGVAVTGLKGFRILPPTGDAMGSSPIPRTKDYRKTDRVPLASDLVGEPRKIAHKLVEPLIVPLGGPIA